MSYELKKKNKCTKLAENYDKMLNLLRIDTIQHKHIFYVNNLCILDKHNIQYLTNSNISCFSSKCLSSLRDKRCDRCWWLVVEPIWLAVEPIVESFCGQTLKNVGVPSMVFTMGFNKPPRSNSCAEIFLSKRKEKDRENYIYINGWNVE